MLNTFFYCYCFFFNYWRKPPCHSAFEHFFGFLYPADQHVGYLTGHGLRKNGKHMEIPYMDHITTYKGRRNVFLFLTSPSSHLTYSPFVLKKDIFVSWEIIILTSRDELLIERRGHRDSWHAADYVSVTKQLKHSYMYVACTVGRDIHFTLGDRICIYWVLCNMSTRQTRVQRKDSGPHELCCSLQIFIC